MEDGKKSYFVVILIQSIYAVFFMLSKAALNNGMNSFVFTFYREAFATLFLAPFAAFEWKKAPPLSFRTFCKIFLLSLFGITLSLNLLGYGLIYTTSTMGAATSNGLPIVTFLFALLLKMEVLKLRSKSGIVKLAGISFCMGGALTIAFYKGPGFDVSCQSRILGHHIIQLLQSHVSSGRNWILGCFLLLLGNTCLGLWLVLQGLVLKSYPSKLLLTTLQCFLSAIQSFVVAIIFERDFSQWKLEWNIRLLAVSYSGIVANGVLFYLQAWVIEKKGPVFLAMFTPVSLIITTFCSAFLLCETIRLGSILGALLLVSGLYSVLWGKYKEKRLNERSHSSVHAEVEIEPTQVKQIVINP